MPPQRKFRAEVVSLISYGETIRKFTLKPELALPRFMNGQFLQLALDDYDPSSNWPESRAFSIASSDRDQVLEIIVSQKGSFTRKMFKEMVPGRKVWVRMPFGNFNMSNIKQPLVLIAGGTGISPLIPFLRGLEKGYDFCVSLFYGIKSVDSIIINDLISSLQTKDFFNLNLYVEDSFSESETYYMKGIIDVELAIYKALEDNAKIYISGPTGLIEKALNKAKERGLPSDQLFFDEWQ